MERGASPAELSRGDIVAVRDGWNKFLAFDEMLIEMFFERLLLDAPELVDQFGLAIDQAPYEFLQLFDLAVRALDPATEEALREAYHQAPAARAARARTLADCGAFFATYGMTPEQWRAAEASFVWVFGRVPYAEEAEREYLARKSGIRRWPASSPRGWRRRCSTSPSRRRGRWRPT